MSAIDTARPARGVVFLVLAFVISWRGSAPAQADEQPDPFVRANPGAPWVRTGPVTDRWLLSSASFREGLDSAVARGVAWLVARQSGDGRWSRRAYTRWCGGKEDPTHPLAPVSPLAEDYDVGLTGLALEALLDAGVMPGDQTPAADALSRGLDYLRSVQDAEGCVGRRVGYAWMHAHAFAANVLVRAYAATGAVNLRGPAQRALTFSDSARTPYFVWRNGRKPSANDTCVTGAVLFQYEIAEALKYSGRAKRAANSLDSNWNWRDGTVAWLDKMMDSDYGRYGNTSRGSGVVRYTFNDAKAFPREASEGMTAIGLYAGVLCDLVMWNNPGPGRRAIPRRVETIPKSLKLIHERLPAWNIRKGSVDQYYWWYAARAFAMIGSAPRAWKLDRHASEINEWRTACVGSYLGAQVAGDDPCQRAGSWDPVGAWGSVGGRVYSTALAVSTLRHCGYETATLLTASVDPSRTLRQAASSREDRLLVLAALGEDALRKPLLKAVVTAARKSEPIVRLAAAEALARLGPLASSARVQVAKHFRKEPTATVRRALLFALLRMGKGSKMVQAAIELGAADPDAGVRFLASVTGKALEGGPDAVGAQALADLPNAEEVVALALYQGRIELTNQERRATRIVAELIDAVGLPHRIGPQLGLRRPPISSDLLGKPGVIEAIEAAFEGSVETGAALRNTLGLYEAAINAIFESDGSNKLSHERLILTAALEVHLGTRARAIVVRADHTVAPAAEWLAALTALRFRLRMRAQTLNAASELGRYAPLEPRWVAALLVRLALNREDGLLQGRPEDSSTPGPRGRAIAEQTTWFTRLHASSGARWWITLGLVRLERRALRLSKRAEDAEGRIQTTTQMLSILLRSTRKTLNVRRTKLRATALSVRFLAKNNSDIEAAVASLSGSVIDFGTTLGDIRLLVQVARRQAEIGASAAAAATAERALKAIRAHTLASPTEVSQIAALHAGLEKDAR